MNDIEKALSNCKIALEVWENDDPTDEVSIARQKSMIEKETTKIKALEKQIPKKPADDSVMDETFWGQEPFERKIKVCPSCKNIYLRNGQEYCDKCGQAIDWSKDE